MREKAAKELAKVAASGDAVLVSNGVYRVTNQIVIATNFTLSPPPPDWEPIIALESK